MQGSMQCGKVITKCLLLEASTVTVRSPGKHFNDEPDVRGIIRMEGGGGCFSTFVERLAGCKLRSASSGSEHARCVRG